MSVQTYVGICLCIMSIIINPLKRNTHKFSSGIFSLLCLYSWVHFLKLNFELNVSQIFLQLQVVSTLDKRWPSSIFEKEWQIESYRKLTYLKRLNIQRYRQARVYTVFILLLLDNSLEFLYQNKLKCHVKSWLLWTDMQSQNWSEQKKICLKSCFPALSLPSLVNPGL